MTLRKSGNGLGWTESRAGEIKPQHDSLIAREVGLRRKWLLEDGDKPNGIMLSATVIGPKRARL